MQLREPMSVRLSHVSRQANYTFRISWQAEPGQFITLALDFPIHIKSQRKLTQSG